MTVTLPALEWPSELLAVGPEQDRSILLRAPVVIGAAKFVLTAVRVDPIELSPDYRSDIKPHIYDDYQLPQLLDMVYELMNFTEPSPLQLEAGPYIVWITPSDHF